MKNSEFGNILDDCLGRLIKGETVEQCLKSYPEQAAELEPLLRTAQVAKEAAAIEPRAEFRARARYEFRSALHAQVSKKQPRFALRRGWVVALLIISLLLVSGGGTALAASDSMPDSPLYSVKLVTEQVQLALTPSATGKARLCAAFTDRRVAEIIYMAAKGDVQQVEAVIQRLDERLDTLTLLVSAERVTAAPVDEAPRMLTEEPAMAPPPVPAPMPEAAPVAPSKGKAKDSAQNVPGEKDGRPGLKLTVANCAASQSQALRNALSKAPPSVKPALERAIIVSETGYRKALAAID